MGWGKCVIPLLLAATLVGVLSVASACAPQAMASPQATAGERSVTVLGRATVSGKPDLAQVSVGVETVAANVGEASQQNNAKMVALMAKLAELGIAEKDIQTSNFNISSERRPGPEGPETVNQYRVSNMVQVKIRDLSRVGPVLDAAIAAGANQVWGVSFTIEDSSALEAEARIKAVEDARQRGEALAKLAKVQLGQVLAISEGGTVTPIYRYGLGGGGAAPEPAIAVPVSISSGEVQVSYQVQVTYAIQ